MTNLPIVKKILLCAAMVPLFALAPHAGAQLKAGASRVDITPDVADLPKPFNAIGTNIYVRSLVLENGGKRVIIAVADLPTIAPDVLDDLIKRIAAAGDTSTANVVMAVTHTHSGVRLANDGMGVILPGSTKITKITEDKIVDSVKQAVGNLQPARAGYATGPFHLATSRAQAPQQQPGAASNQAAEPETIGIFKVESETGDTIALLVNGGPEPTMGGQAMNTKVGADVAGVMDRYLEQRFGDKAVVLYTVSALPQLVVNARQRVQGATPADPNAIMSAVGTVLGEEALSAAARIKLSSDLQLSGAVKILTCPGKATTPLNNAGSCSDAPGSQLPRCVFTDHDTAPVDLRIGVIRLGDLSVVDADANIDATVWAELMSQAPDPANTMLVALDYGPVHYVEPDAIYPSNSYPVTASMVKAGCAEKGFVNDSLTMLKVGTSGAR